MMVPKIESLPLWLLKGVQKNEGPVESSESKIVFIVRFEIGHTFGDLNLYILLWIESYLSEVEE